MKIIFLLRAPMANRDEFISWAVKENKIDLKAYYIQENEPGHKYITKLKENIILPKIKNKLLKIIGWNYKIKEVMKENRVCVWIIYGYNSLTMIYAILYCIRKGIPLILRHDSILLVRRNVLRVLLKNTLVKYIHKKADAILYNGKANLEYTRTFGVPQDKLFFCPLPVAKISDYSISSCSGDKKEKYNIKEEVLILFVGRLLKLKRVQYLIDAFSKIDYNKYNACLVIVGDGVYRKKLEYLVEKKSISSVYFLGYLDKLEVEKIYGISDIFVLPSTMEMWGWVINEAIIFGLPVIASDRVGAGYDVISHGENGFIFKSSNAQELTNYLHILIKDKELRKKMGERGRAIISKYGFEQKLNGLLNAVNYVRK